MNRLPVSVLVFWLFTQCMGDDGLKSKEQVVVSLFDEPIHVNLASSIGYQINPVTGDSIKDVLTRSGDTIHIGQTVSARKKIIDPSKMRKAVVKLAGIPKKVDLQNSITIVPDRVKRIAIKDDKLWKFTIGQDSCGFQAKNSIGELVPTGAPIEVIPNVRRLAQSKPIRTTPAAINSISPVNMKYLNIEHGLLSTHVSVIFKDSRGRVWFGSDIGLSVFDGQFITNFTKKEGLLSNDIYSILEDRSGNIWFASNGGGVCVYDGQNIKCLTEKEGMLSNFVRCLYEDSKGRIWFGSYGVSVWDGKTVTHFTEKEGLTAPIMSIMEDSNGNMWFGTWGQGVNKFDGKTFTRYSTKDGLSNNVVQAIEEDNQGNMWFGTRGGGVNKYDGHFITQYTINEGLAHDDVWAITKDRMGRLWFGTWGGGASVYDGVSFKQLTNREGLNHNIVRSIMEDDNGDIWFGTWGGGVNIHYGDTFQNYKKAEGLNHFVYDMMVDSKDDVWFGSWGGGVTKYDGQSFTRYTEKEGLSSNSVYSILEDSQGNYWFSTFGGGVSKFDGQNFTQYTVENGLNTNRVTALYEDSNGDIWFGFWNGTVCKYDGDHFTQYIDKKKLRGHLISAIIEDREGNMWFGSHGSGLSKFDGEKFRYYTEKDGLSSNVIKTIIEDHKGLIWIGTWGGGISAFNGESLINFTEQQGLNSNSVYSMIEDNDNRIWITTTSGVNCLINDDSLAIGNKIYSYYKQDGVIALSSVCKDRSNRLWWGSDNGMTMLDLNKFKLPVEKAKMKLARIDINEQFYDYMHLKSSSDLGFEYEQVKPFQNYPSSLKLTYDKNHLTFYFSAQAWKASHKIKYSYVMDGVNDYWSTPSSKTMADYRNLPYGDHTFMVRAINESMEWTQPLEYSFTISPPWWRTWWAYLIFIVSSVAIVYTIVRVRTAYLYAKKKQLEKQVSNRTNELYLKNEELKVKNERIVMQAEELNTYNDKLEDLNQSLENRVAERTSELTHKNEILEDIAFVNSHELRKPVSNILGLVQLFDFNMNSVDQKQVITNLKKVTNNLDYQVRKIQKKFRNNGEE
ncbi:MAG: hypothetical protein OCD76_00800 [Reichenbachiella sp.]